MITAAGGGDQGIISTVQVALTQVPPRPTFTAAEPVGVKVSPEDGVQTGEWSLSMDLRMQLARGATQRRIATLPCSGSAPIGRP